MAINKLLSDQEAYRTLLDVYSSEQINYVINNDFFEHSSSVYERFFMDCNDNILVFARGIKDEIFNITRVKNSIERYLTETQGKISFILAVNTEKDRDDILESDFYSFLRNTLNDNGLYERIDFTFSYENNGLFDEYPSVSIGDDRMYRLRYTKSPQEIKNTGKAKVNFAAPEEVEKLKQNIIDIKTKIANENAKNHFVSTI